MELNKDYKQISVYNLSTYDDLKGKVVDKVAFNDRGNTDENMFIITFTDKTYVAVGTNYRDIDSGDDEPQLENFYVMEPKSLNFGDFRHHCWVGSDGKLEYDRWMRILMDLGIWHLDDNLVQSIIENNKKCEEEREYQQYLRLKEKFEK